MSKQFVSLDQALGYLQFLNNSQQAFTNKQFKLSQIPVEQKNNKPVLIKRPTQFKPAEKNLMSDNNSQEGLGKKTLNKNRAIKRIIDTSKQILSANYKYEEPPQNDKKSFITQFNIYLKQYNRLSEQILTQEHEREELRRQFIEHQQEQLQNVYNYTVEEDFRELVQVSILKDKINKTNVQLVMETFKLCLVVVRPNQLKIYQKSREESHRDIKLHEIENVDYFSQPYIFTVMTIVKDKSSTSQFLCFKFDCIEKQHKWDRAIYCNYISRKMKHKGKYFQLEFPEKEEEKQDNEGLEHVIKKRDDSRNYEVDKKKILKNLQTQKQKERSKQGTRMGTAGMDTQRDRDLPSDKRGIKMQRFNTEHQINMVSPSRESYNYNMLSTKNADQKPYFDSGMKGNKRKNPDENQEEDLSASQKTSKPNTTSRPNQNPPNTNSNSNSIINLNNNPNPNPSTPMNNPTPGPTNINTSTVPNNETKQNPPAGEPKNIFLNESMAESEVDVESISQQKITNPYTKRKIELREKHEKGIKVAKVKFFADKPKLMYLANDEIQYWDYDEATVHRSEKKLIPFGDLKIYRLVKEKPPFISFELTNKKLEFTAKQEDLNDIIEWIELQKKEKQFELAKPKNLNEEKKPTNSGLFIL